MGRHIGMDQLEQEAGELVDKLTRLALCLRRGEVTLEEYVCLKVLTMLSHEETQSALTPIRERYMGALRSHLAATKSSQPIRLDYLLGLTRLVEGAADLLMRSKMFYVPFLLNSAACIANLHLNNCSNRIATTIHGNSDNGPLASPVAPVVRSPAPTSAQP
ncbi:hypothetical protein BIW11_08511 [Tropilaelaps mercedesae]|uniref:NR LBD domain-containing protein n=1 Tax=Tropilaelaps mercedesae TaxID=418985 RepID=A0A1V9XPG6_9ACAR|nr:hypothetical protein BIW11_08511 [Tropilaelaps mercedesae]